MTKVIKTNLVTSGYCFITQSYQSHCLYGAFARGVDIVDCDKDGKSIGQSNIRPRLSGNDEAIVIYAGDGDGYGLSCWLDHGKGIITGYGHMRSLSVKTGDKVNKNSILGQIGTTGNSTGVHLHFCIRLYKKPWTVVPSRAHFWDAGSFNDTNIFSWYDPTESIPDETNEPTVENRYRVINKNIQVGAYTNLDNAKREAERQKKQIMIFDSYKGVYLDV